MTIEERLNAIERNQQIIADNLNGLINMVGKLRINTDADISGTRQSVANITPYIETKKAYYGYDALPFYNVPDGNVQVIFSNYNGEYAFKRVGHGLLVTFEKLTEPTDVTISITQ